MISYKLVNPAASLLADAPRAVESFHPGHWDLTLELEYRAPEIIARKEVNSAASFLSDVVFLKRPHTTDRALVKEAVLAFPAAVMDALNALSCVAELGYAAMDELSKVPFFGRGGGRSFNSAVLRLACPRFFGIVDWRNVAVLCGSPGFEGLVTPRVTFEQ